MNNEPTRWISSGPALQPGEWAEMWIQVPPEIAARVARGERLTVEHGPVVETEPRHYERMLDFRLDGELVLSGVVAWEGPTWYQRIAAAALPRTDKRWVYLWACLLGLDVAWGGFITGMLVRIVASGPWLDTAAYAASLVIIGVAAHHALREFRRAREKARRGIER